MAGFAVVPGGFVRDGRPHRVLSRALHYFRMRPQQWRHRLRMLRAMGLNCVETYVAWNLHEPPRRVRLHRHRGPGPLVRLVRPLGRPARTLWPQTAIFVAR